ncbi:MAG: WbqC family protein [Hoeflea sp.]|uniref:WbqC family protein n=1 Tax=Hoeflea sp. TaxID=1940281 RepID=UPI0032983848
MNRALRSGVEKARFTIPVSVGPLNQPVDTKSFSPKASRAFEKLLRTLSYTYAKAPHVDRAIAIVEAVKAHLDTTLDFTNVTAFALQQCFDATGITTPIRRVSELALDQELKAQARIIAACQKTGATRYVNMIGGENLYNAIDFAAAGITLAFMKANLQPYPQSGYDFIPGLSILDMISHLAPDQFAPHLVAAARDANDTM